MSATSELIAGIRGRGISVSEVSDADVTSVLTSLLREYSRQRPLLATTTFDTVEDQAEYEWQADIGDADGIRVLKCLWGYDRSLSTWGFHVSDWQLFLQAEIGAFDYHLPSQHLVEQMKTIEAAKIMSGSAYQLQDGGDVYLDPAPSEDDITVWLLYAKSYGDIDDIPAVDYDIFLDLAESRLCNWIVRKLAASAVAARVKTPEYEREVGRQITYWKTTATEKYTQFIEKAQAGYAAAART
jgi:hypothetical protein